MTWQVTQAEAAIPVDPTWQVTAAAATGTTWAPWQITAAAAAGAQQFTLTASPGPYEPGDTVVVTAWNSVGGIAGGGTWAVAAISAGDPPELEVSDGTARFALPATVAGTKITLRYTVGELSRFVDVDVLRASDLVGGQPARTWVYRSEVA